MDDIFIHALGMKDPKSWCRGHKTRVGSTLCELGWQKRRRRGSGQKTTYYPPVSHWVNTFLENALCENHIGYSLAQFLSEINTPAIPTIPVFEEIPWELRDSIHPLYLHSKKFLWFLVWQVWHLNFRSGFLWLCHVILKFVSRSLLPVTLQKRSSKLL